MSEVKIHTVNSEDLSPRIVGEGFCTDVVRYSDYAAMEAKCAALAAENAGLKSKAAELVHEASEVYSAYNATITEPDGDFMDMQTLQEMQRVETQATDAFLAEVRAQAIESLLTESFRADIAGALADFDGMDEQSLQTLIWSGQPPEPDGDVWCVEYMSRAAAVLRKVREFAAQLRKGEAQ